MILCFLTTTAGNANVPTPASDVLTPASDVGPNTAALNRRHDEEVAPTDKQAPNNGHISDTNPADSALSTPAPTGNGSAAVQGFLSSSSDVWDEASTVLSLWGWLGKDTGQRSDTAQTSLEVKITSPREALNLNSPRKKPGIKSVEPSHRSHRKGAALRKSTVSAEEHPNKLVSAQHVTRRGSVESVQNDPRLSGMENIMDGHEGEMLEIKCGSPAAGKLESTELEQRLHLAKKKVPQRPRQKTIIPNRKEFKQTDRKPTNVAKIRMQRTQYFLRKEKEKEISTKAVKSKIFPRKKQVLVKVTNKKLLRGSAVAETLVREKEADGRQSGTPNDRRETSQSLVMKLVSGNKARSVTRKTKPERKKTNRNKVTLKKQTTRAKTRHITPKQTTSVKTRQITPKQKNGLNIKNELKKPNGKQRLDMRKEKKLEKQKTKSTDRHERLARKRKQLLKATGEKMKKKVSAIQQDSVKSDINETGKMKSQDKDNNVARKASKSPDGTHGAIMKTESKEMGRKEKGKTNLKDRKKELKIKSTDRKKELTQVSKDRKHTRKNERSKEQFNPRVNSLQRLANTTERDLMVVSKQMLDLQNLRFAKEQQMQNKTYSRSQLLQLKKRKIKRQINIFKQQMDAVKKDMTALKTYMEAKEKQMTGSKNQMDANKKQMLEIRKQMDSYKKQMTLVKRWMDGKKKQMSEIKKRMDAKKKQMTVFKKRMAAKKKQMTVFKKRMAAKKKQMSEIKKRLAAKKKQMTVFKKRMNAKKKQMSVIKKGMDAKKKLMTAIKKETDAKKEEMLAIRNQMDPDKRRMALSKMRMDAKKKQINALMSDIGLVEDEIAANKSQVFSKKTRNPVTLRDKPSRGVSMEMLLKIKPPVELRNKPSRGASTEMLLAKQKLEMLQKKRMSVHRKKGKTAKRNLAETENKMWTLSWSPQKWMLPSDLPSNTDKDQNPTGVDLFSSGPVERLFLAYGGQQVNQFVDEGIYNEVDDIDNWVKTLAKAYKFPVNTAVIDDVIKVVYGTGQSGTSKWSDWGPFSECMEPCGGQQSRVRFCMSLWGESCEGSSLDVKPCQSCEGEFADNSCSINLDWFWKLILPLKII